MIRYAAVLALTAPLTLATPASAQGPADAPLVALVKDFVEAERTFDQKRLATLVTEDYAEISPLGELDLHDAFLGFYAADKKQPAPPMTLGEPLVRRYGDAASIITTLSFERPGPDGQPRTASIRVGFLAVKKNGGWKLASAQYTPERPKAPPAAAK